MEEEDAAYWKPSDPAKLPVMSSSDSQGQNVQPQSTSFLTRRKPGPNVGSTRDAGPSTRTHDADVAELNVALTSAITASARPETTESQANKRAQATRVFNLSSEDVLME